MKILSQKLVVLLLAALTAGLAVGTVVVAWRLHCEAKARHHNNLGVALMDPDAANDVDFDGAIREFETALRTWPRYHIARVNLGIALFRAEKEDRAMDVLQEACRGDPGDLRVEYTLGLIKARRRLYREAERHFALVLETDPDDPCTLLQAGLCQLDAGALDAAEKTFRRIISRWPSLWTANYHLGRILTAAGRKQEARAFFQRQPKGTEDQERFVTLPLGPVSRMQRHVDRYAQILADSTGRGEHTDPKPEHADVSRELGVAFQHAGTSSDDQVRRILSGEAVGREWLLSEDNQRKLIAGIGAGCGFADFNGDGRLDFFLVNTNGRHALYAQGPDGGFQDVTVRAGIGPEPQLGMACVWGDYDDDGWTDLCIAGYGGLSLYRNDAGTFEDVTARAGICEPFASETWYTGAAFADVDHDGDIDLYVSCLADLSRIPTAPAIKFPDDFEGQPDLLFRNNRDGTFTEIAGRWDARERPGKSRGAWFCDVDDDRVIDLISCDLAGRRRVFLNRLDGTFLPAGELAGSFPLSPPVGESRAHGDFNGDGTVDVLANRNGGAAALLRNQAVPASWLAVRAKRYEEDKGNRRCIGARVDVRTSEGWQRKDLTAGNRYFGCDPPDAHFSLGGLKTLEYVRVTFPSGIQTSARDVPVNQVLVLEEPDLVRGSCPLVFSWNGERFEFITDAISAGIIGEPVAPGSYWTPDPDEWLRIGGESLRARGGFLDIRFVNALEEVTYLDRVRLMAADHPAGSAVYPDEKMVGEPSHRRPARLYVLTDLRGVAGAIDQRGQDVTKTLQDVDRRYFDGFQLSPFKGFTEDWSLTLDLGSGSPGVLLLHGWTAWNSSASALAAHQAGKTAFGPVLDVQDRQGSWRVVRKDVGVPAGLPRAMLVDLREVLREGERVVRIRTNRTVHFDQALVADVVEVVEPSPDRTAASLRLTKVPLLRADLRRLGYPQRILPEGRRPEVYDYQRIASVAEWETHEGPYTRFGEVAPLLGSVDDRFAIMAHGDEIALHFDANVLSALPEGWHRTFLLCCDGYEKGMEIHGAYPRTVEPLPFQAMPYYPYPQGSYPADAFHLEYFYGWNTRLEVGVR